MKKFLMAMFDLGRRDDGRHRGRGHSMWSTQWGAYDHTDDPAC